jgi:amino acid transporter
MSGNHNGRAQLGLPAVVAIGVGGMVGGGIFAVLGLAVQLAGGAPLSRSCSPVWWCSTPPTPTPAFR